MIEAIDTKFRGYRFRSRLEARWAAYFDALNMPWEYEPEGFQFDDGTRYLPDFWLPQVNMWAEVKPKPLTDDEKRKCKALADGTGFPCLMLVGTPDAKPYWAVNPSCKGTEWPDESDYALSNYKDYPNTEHRFFVAIGPDGEDRLLFAELFPDTILAATAARHARFEYGEAKGLV